MEMLERAERTLFLPPALLEGIFEHARRETPRECCGLLAGQGDVASAMYPLVNEAADEREFFVARGLIGPFRVMRQKGQILVAIYHSHPADPPIPSKKDLDRSYYPETIQLIVSLAGGRPLARAYLYRGASYWEIPVKNPPPVDPAAAKPY